MEDTWFNRDLPVLDELVRRVDTQLQTGIPTLRDVAEATGLEMTDVGNAAIALEQADLIELTMLMTGGDPGPWFVTNVSASARQQVGAWPTAENLAQRILAALEQQYATETDPERRTWLRRFLDGAGGVAHAAALDLMSSTLSKIFTGQ